ncbi:hypothetical protein PybrP1_012481 [[Pythium] brassicae (nom. inval.)]|nr:hypothetical protein PybrP1_012481 [[Pythium] brassicae (nom. inval.)]
MAAPTTDGGGTLRRVRRFVTRHPALVAFVALASLVASLLYEPLGAGRPRAALVKAPALADLELRGSAQRPRALWRDEDFECLGWRATFGCDPFGTRDRGRDRSCAEPVPTHTSGYCELRNASSGEHFRVLLSTCRSWRASAALTCADARAFTDFSIRARDYAHPPALPAPAPPRRKKSGLKAGAVGARAAEPPVSFARGVVLIAFPKAAAGVYAIVRLLRFLGCALPVEVWFDPVEMRATHSVLTELAAHHGVFLRTIADPRASRFHAKPYALYHSRFESVLFLDSDNLPVRDPTYLFDSPEFARTGALFWPDFWRPSEDTVFNDFFCGVAMVQRDPQGELVFVHRNQAKLSGRRDQKVLVTHYQKFTGGDGTAQSLRRELDKYRIQCKVRRLGQYVCFRINPVAPEGGPTPLLIQSLAGTRYPALEQQAIHFSIEGRSLLSPLEEAEVAALEEEELDRQQAEADAAHERRRQADRTWYALALCGALLGIGVAWRWRGCRKRRPRGVSGAAAAAPHVGARKSLGSADLECELGGGSSAVRRKKSTSVQFDEQHRE